MPFNCHEKVSKRTNAALTAECQRGGKKLALVGGKEERVKP